MKQTVRKGTKPGGYTKDPGTVGKNSGIKPGGYTEKPPIGTK